LTAIGKRLSRNTSNFLTKERLCSSLAPLICLNSKLLYSFVTLAMLAGVRVCAQTGANATDVFPNTNILYSFPSLAFAQGTCNDGTNTYWFGTTTLDQKDTNYFNTGPHNDTPAAGLTGFPKVHLGDGDYFDCCIYCPMEAAVGVPKGSANIDIAIFTTPNLARIAAVSISNYQSEVSADCIDPILSNSVALFATSWASAFTNDGIYEYSVNNTTNITFVKVLPMTQHIQYMQGIICVAGMLYVLADNGLAGEMYQVNPTNGVVVHLIQLYIPGEGEWEGLDYFHGFLVANEGATGTANWYDFFGLLRHGGSWAITGSVKDSNHNPIVGVGVSATAFINGTNQIVTMDTDTNGNYSLPVSNGTWTVTVDYNTGADSLDNLGNYFPPNSQFISIGNDNGAANFIVQICDGVSITTPPPLPAGEVGVFYSQTLQASSCDPIFTWTNTGGSLPSGLSLSSGGVLSGTPSGPGGVFNFIAQVTDGNNATTNQSFSVGISNAVQVTTSLLPDGTNISFYNVPLSAANGQPAYTWSLTPGSNPLPTSLSLTTNGVLLGMPATHGTFNFSVHVTDAFNGTADQPLVLNLAPANPPSPAISIPGGQIPPLAIGTIDGEPFVFWSASATNYALQTTTNLVSPNWLTVSDAVPGAAYNVTSTAPQQYFRLQ